MIKGRLSEYPTVNAEIAGPNINPNPNEAPIIPKPFARSFSEVVSVMTADATGILPAVMPSRARAINKNMALGANAIKKNERAVPVNDATRSGFLPYLSDILPIIGVDKNWQTENVANKSPFWKSESPYFWE